MNELDTKSLRMNLELYVLLQSLCWEYALKYALKTSLSPLDIVHF